MLKILRVTLLLLCFGLLTLPTFAQSIPDAEDYIWTPIVSGFDNPIALVSAGDERLFGVEQLGRIWVIVDGEELPDPFLDISLLISPDVFSGGYSERGLLGLAFHPDYANNGMFFINYTDINGNTVIARYNVSADDPNLADAFSQVPILEVQQPFANHNGGQLAFGPDGYLYIGLGDGGDQGDPYGNAQNMSSLLGKILRIDINTPLYTIPEDNPFVDVEGAAPEIWAMGLRNPWRFSFDRETGDLFISDVGEDQFEEINIQPANSAGGENYGWEIYEGENLRDDTAPDLEITMPTLTYTHAEGCSITGGYMYRGLALPEFYGVYFYGDYCSGKIFTAYADGAGIWHTELFMETGFQISSFGEDMNGELYLVDYKGGFYRLERAE